MIMKLIIFISLTLIILNSCSRKTSVVNYGSPTAKQELIDESTFKLSGYSGDKTYGYSEKNPVMVGGGMDNGPQNERRFLNALAGPKGETISYYRVGSCCSFQTKNSAFGGGVLDIYDITYEGIQGSLKIYMNMYDSDTLKVPVGLKMKIE
jgi:acyl-CoA synthetase (AMP-forming)/AMP-acid ligase II